MMRGIDLKKIAEKMNGASGAELKVRALFSRGIPSDLSEAKKCVDVSVYMILSR